MKRNLIIFLAFFSLSLSFLQSTTQSTLPAQPYPHHGFLTGTLVKVPGGYKAIEELAPLDIVLARNEGGEYEERTILRISRVPVSKYTKIVIDDIKICAGCDQQFYVDNQLVTAAEITNNSALVDHAKTIKRIAFVHALCVEGQTFCVTPYDIPAHNSDELAACATAAAFVIESLITIHPISVLIGSAVALANLGYALYEENQQKNALLPETNAGTIASDQAVLLQERTYFQARKKVLIDLKQDFINTQKALELLQNLRNTNSANFTCEFFQSIKPAAFTMQLEPSAAQELQMYAHQKEALQKRREAELAHLEQEIQFAQITLAFHFCKLVNRVEQAIKEHNKTQKNLNTTISHWNICSKKPSIKIARDLYETYCQYEEVIDNFERCNRELQVVIGFYKNPSNAIVLKKSTDIARLLPTYERFVAKNTADIIDIRSSITKNKSTLEKQLKNLGIAAVNVKNATQEKAQKKCSDLHAKYLAEAAKKRSNFKPPKKPDDDEKKKNERVTAKAGNMNEVFEKHAARELLKHNSEQTGRAYKQTSPIHRITKDIPTHGIKKGDYFYLDKMHGDHIEVFSSKGEMPVRTVLNLDGSINVSKANAASGRTLAKYIR